MDELEDIHILSLNTASGIEHKDADIAILDRADRTHYRIELKVLGNLILTTDTCRVDKIEVETELIVSCVDTIAGGTCDISYDITLLADEGVDET